MQRGETAQAPPGRVRSYVIAALVFLLFVGLGWMGFRWAERAGLAELISAAGTPERDRAGEQGHWVPAEHGDEFFGGDGARTDAKETATFRLFNGARLSLKQQSKVRFQTKPERHALGVTVEVGEADIETKQGVLVIDSEFGPIRILGNTKMALRRDGARLGVAVELGAIELGQTGRVLKEGEQVEIELGGVIIAEPLTAPPAASAETAAAPVGPPLEQGDGVSVADLVVTAGDTFTVHDPKPPTRVGVAFDNVCHGGPAELRTGKLKTQAQHVARLQLSAGRHEYVVRCLDDLSRVAQSGTITVLSDAGTRNLPTFAPSANVSTDGRQYTVLYQHRLPQVHVTWPNAPSASSYTLQLDGRSITTQAPAYSLNNLARGTHQLTFSAVSSPPRKSRTTTVSVVYDAQAPTARVAIPPGGYDAGSPVDVAGQALPGWTVSVAGKQLEVDGQRRFSARVTPQASLPITFSHPSHGTHYYLRRSKSSAP